jgi:uncharacterized protein (DUF2336 family)
VSLTSISAQTATGRADSDALDAGADAPLTLGAGVVLDAELAQNSRTRALLTERLADVVGWPGTRIPPHERQMAADILMGLLRTAGVGLRAKLAQRLAILEDAPKDLLRYLARDEISVSGPLLAEGASFDDSDLLATIRAGVAAHWRAIAGRRGLSEIVSESLLQTGDHAVVRIVLQNRLARLSHPGLDFAVRASQDAPDLIAPLLERPELRPTQALVLFWWAPFEQRAGILRRYAAERQALISELHDVFIQAASERWNDVEARKALQAVERRQRNREALKSSVFNSLEDAIEKAAQSGMTRALLQEIARLGGVQPRTMHRMAVDKGGEALAVFAKATGLKKPALTALWKAVGRPPGDALAQDNPFGRLMFVYDILSAAKAQSALRYWDWAFTDEPSVDETDAPEEADGPSRRAALLLRKRFAVA